MERKYWFNFFKVDMRRKDKYIVHNRKCSDDDFNIDLYLDFEGCSCMCNFCICTQYVKAGEEGVMMGRVGYPKNGPSTI